MKRKGQVSFSTGPTMDVLIVGSIAYDSVASPIGNVQDALGGSATYAGLACSFHAKRLSLEQVHRNALHLVRLRLFQRLF